MSAARLRVPLFALFACLVLAFNQAGSQDKSEKKTTLKVLMPELDETQLEDRIRLQIDGKNIKGKGKERTVPAPDLTKGKEQLKVTATWATNNYTKFFRTRLVTPKPGETIVVDLRKEDPKNRDHIDIRYVPTPDDVVARMCKLANVTKDDIVYDLGCGDGRIVIAAVGDFKAKSGVGVDLDPERVKDSKENLKKRPELADKIEFRQEDVLKLKDLSKATVVMLYMGEDVNLRLRPILQKTLKPGSRIVSHRFGMGDWKEEKADVFTAADGDEYTLLLWTIK